MINISNILVFFLICTSCTSCDSVNILEINMRPNLCKWIIPNNILINQRYFSLFSNNDQFSNTQLIFNKYAIGSRSNSILCGMDGSSFEEKQNTNNEMKQKITNLYKEMEDIENNFNGEINETNDIIQLETDLANLTKQIQEYKSKITSDKL